MRKDAQQVSDVYKQVVTYIRSLFLFFDKNRNSDMNLNRS